MSWIKEVTDAAQSAEDTEALLDYMDVEQKVNTTPKLPRSCKKSESIRPRRK
jgi:hypothetical protein